MFSPAVIAAVAAALLAAGCGDSGSEADADSAEIVVETGSLSKERFIKRADAICKTGQEQLFDNLDAFAKENKQPPEGPDRDAWFFEAGETVAFPHYEKQIEEISTLGAPSGDEQEVAAFLTTFQQRIDQLREEPDELTSSPDPFAKAGKLAAAYGLTGCATALGVAT